MIGLLTSFNKLLFYYYIYTYWNLH